MLLVCAWLTLVHTAGAALNTENPTAFFNTVAGRLLDAELDVDIQHIELYPTNRYTAAVHRLLQLTANIYDCTTNRPLTSSPYLPSVFRPRFVSENGTVFVSGYVEETGTDILTRPGKNLESPEDRGSLQHDDRVAGIPLIIGARKGYPNFNELSCDTSMSVNRQLEFRRVLLSGPIIETNVMYQLTVSNTFGLECWNPYTNTFPRDVELRAAASIVFTITNDHSTLAWSNSAAFSACIDIPAGTWPGWSASNAFQVPIATNWFMLPPSVYRHSTGTFALATGSDPFERVPPFPLVEWDVSLALEVDYALVDKEAQRIMDYVHLASRPQVLDLTRFIETLEREVNYWDPYRTWAHGPTRGMLFQINAGLGHLDAPSILRREIDIFRHQFHLLPLYFPNLAYYRSNLFYCPIQAQQTVYLSTSWSANDPLLHSRLEHLVTPATPFNTLTRPGLQSLGRLNFNYLPQDGSHRLRREKEPEIYMDPWIVRPDDWDFPENLPLGLAWLGRVHRATPWQSVYWKSGIADPAVWFFMMAAPWNELSAMQPHGDRRLPDILAPLFTTFDPDPKLSINQPDVTAWANRLAGLTVWTNDQAGSEYPLELSPDMPEVVAIATALDTARRDKPAGYFTSLGDVLTTPALSLNTPFAYPYPFPNLEKVYEALPSQLMGMLMVDCVATMDGSAVRFSGWEGLQYVVQESTDLVNWTAVSTNMPRYGSFEYHPSFQEKGFYRAVQIR